MKLMIVILAQENAAPAVDRLVASGFRLTRVPSTGGFLRQANVTLLMGIEEDRIEQALEILRQVSADPASPGLRRATVLIVPVERFEQV
jgi:uncharacterized protein YaaQ